MEYFQVLLQVPSSFVHDGQCGCLSAFARQCYLSASSRGGHVGECQVQDFLDACCGGKEQQDHCGVSEPVAGLLYRCPNLCFNGGHGQCIWCVFRCSGWADSFNVQPDRNECRFLPGAVRKK